MGIMKKVGGLGRRAATAPFRAAKKLVGVDHARDNWRWIISLAGSLSPSSVKTGRVETFERAMERQGVGEEQLRKIYANHVIRFWACSALLLVGLGVLATYAASGKWLALFPGLGFAAICLSQMFGASFRARQLALRRFCDVSEWVADTSSWIPKSFSLPAPPKPPKRPGTSLRKVERP